MTEKSKSRVMRDMMAEGIVVSPGIYDGISARLVEKMGFRAASLSGAGLSNSRLGQPDVGVMSLLENVEASQRLANILSIPVFADADTGYGNAVTFYHTVQYFEQAGVAGLNVEDQVSPKRCGHMAGKQVIDAREMARKIEAGVAAKKNPDFLINARTDALAVEGIEGAIARAKLYVSAGADMVYADAIDGEDDIKRFVEAVAPVPVSVNMGFGIRSRPTTPLIAVRRLAELGVRRVTVPRMLPAAAIHAMTEALRLLADSVETGRIHDRPDLIAGIEEVTGLMNYAKINELEARFSLPEDLQRRYGDGPVDLVRRQAH